AALRFSAGLGQLPQVRRQLAGPAPVRPALVPGTVAPPRWWLPTPAGRESSWGAGTSAVTEGASGAPRRLRRALLAVPTLESHRPGAASTAMTGKVVPVRRIPEVAFTGNMKGAASKLVPPQANSPVPPGANGPVPLGANGPVPPGANGPVPPGADKSAHR